jgi:hypothetical protein
MNVNHVTDRWEVQPWFIGPGSSFMEYWSNNWIMYKPFAHCPDLPEDIK